MELEQKQVNGLTLWGIALTASGLLGIDQGLGTLPLVICAVLLYVLGAVEFFRKK